MKLPKLVVYIVIEAIEVFTHKLTKIHTYSQSQTHGK